MAGDAFGDELRHMEVESFINTGYVISFVSRENDDKRFIRYIVVYFLNHL